MYKQAKKLNTAKHFGYPVEHIPHKPKSSNQSSCLVKSFETLPQLLFLLPAPHSRQIATGFLSTARQITAPFLRLVGNWIDGLSERTWCHLTFIILALTLRSVNAFFTDHITDGLGDSSLAQLATDCVVDTVLEVIDLLNLSNFGLVESI